MTTDKIWETFLVVLGGIITGFIGLFTGWLLNKSQRDSERKAGIENRRRDFLAFMEQLRGEAERQRNPGTFAEFYHNKIPNLRYESRLIRDDFPDEKRTRFEKLVTDARAHDRTQAESEGKKRTLESIDTLVSFVEESNG